MKSTNIVEMFTNVKGNTQLPFAFSTIYVCIYICNPDKLLKVLILGENETQKFNIEGQKNR